MKTPIKALKQIGGFDDHIEASRSIGSSVSSSLLNDLLKPGGKDLLKQVGAFEVLGRAKKGGEMHEGEEIDLKNAHKKETIQHVEAAYNYTEKILHGDREIQAETAQETRIKIEEIMIELRKVVESSKELKMEFEQVSVEQISAKPGKYHLNFVEWMLENVREIRMRIEDSGAWLAATHSKKDKKQYWSMFKKHGTSFGLSNERSVATQVG